MSKWSDYLILAQVRPPKTDVKPLLDQAESIINLIVATAQPMFFVLGTWAFWKYIRGK